MLIFWDQRLVFLATPKAGSTAIAMALESLASASLQRPAQMKHTDIGSYRRHVGPWLQAMTGERFTTVALMREPVDWLRSWYRFRFSEAQDDPDQPVPDNSFASFARSYCAPDGPERLGITPQSRFLSDAESRVDRIFRYENIDAFVAFLEERLDCAIELPRANVPPAQDVSLSPDEEQALRQAMAPDLNLYARLD